MCNSFNFDLFVFYSYSTGQQKDGGAVAAVQKPPMDVKKGEKSLNIKYVFYAALNDRLLTILRSF